MCCSSNNPSQQLVYDKLYENMNNRHGGSLNDQQSLLDLFFNKKDGLFRMNSTISSGDIDENFVPRYKHYGHRNTIIENTFEDFSHE